MHGGKANGGRISPTFKHGRYSMHPHYVLERKLIRIAQASERYVAARLAEVREKRAAKELRDQQRRERAQPRLARHIHAYIESRIALDALEGDASGANGGLEKGAE
jgi:hypothetical protein